MIGSRRGPDAGATVLCIAALHGNEPAGVHALRRVFDTLDQNNITLRGELVGLVGNIQALAVGERYLSWDLNRHWPTDSLTTPPTSASNATASAEDCELAELHEVIEDVLDRRRGPVFFLDLHTTSSASAPFVVLNDTLPNRRFASQLGVPIIIGIEEKLEGTLPDYLYRRGCITLGFEAGQHDDPASIDLHESAIWLALSAAGCLMNDLTVDLESHTRRLTDPCKALPRFIEVFHRHAVTDARAFQMAPGFRNFDEIKAGALLAHENGAELRSPVDSLIFLPLYQPHGDDGFFLARRVRPMWMAISTALRRSPLAARSTWLPGVRRHRTRANTVLVRPRIARWYAREIFHLLGFRHESTEDGRLVFSRRVHDVWQHPDAEAPSNRKRRDD